MLTRMLHKCGLRTFPVILAVWLVCALSGLGKDARISLRAQEPWGNVFGETEAVFHFAVTSPETMAGTVTWRFACEGRTLARGEQGVEVTPLRPAVVEIKMAIPPVKEGVIMPATLELAVAGPTGPDQGKAVDELVKPIWIFPENPFAGRMEWLKKLDIRLFDPEGKTAKILESAKVPFAWVTNPDALLEAKKSVVVIGEGLSLRDQRALPEIMVKLADRGVPVLCLALAEGEFPFPGAQGGDLPMPSAVHLKQNHVITELDKKLDSTAWPPDGMIVASRIQLQGDRTGVIAAVTKKDDGWPWVELQFNKSVLVICGFPVMDKWETSPTPRFLLMRMLEKLAGGVQ